MEFYLLSQWNIQKSSFWLTSFQQLEKIIMKSQVLFADDSRL